MPDSSLDTEAQRRRAVHYAVVLTADTPLAPQRYERQLLNRFQQGELTLDQVSELLNASIYQILYRSRATRPLNEPQLQRLLEKSRSRNAAQGITGLLLYSDSHFVQVLEGPEDAVRHLYAKIQHDAWHTQVVTVSEGPAPARRFGEWNMGLGHVASQAVARALETVLDQEYEANTQPDDALLEALLKAFGVEREEKKFETW